MTIIFARKSGYPPSVYIFSILFVKDAAGFRPSSVEGWIAGVPCKDHIPFAHGGGRQRPNHKTRASYEKKLGIRESIEISGAIPSCTEQGRRACPLFLSPSITNCRCKPLVVFFKKNGMIATMKRISLAITIFIGVALIMEPAFALSVIDVKDKTPKDNPCGKSLVPDDIYKEFRDALTKFLSGDAVKGIDKQIADETKTDKTIPVEIYVDDLDGFKKQYKDDRDGIETNKTAEELAEDAENIYNSHPAYTYTTDKKVKGVQTIKVKFFCQKDLRLRTIDNTESSGWKLYEQMLHEFIHVKIYSYDAVGAKPPFKDHDENSDNDEQEEFYKRFKKYFDQYKGTFAAAMQLPEADFMMAAAETVTFEDLGVQEPKLLPTSKLYFLKEWGRGVKKLFTFGTVAKARVELDIANKKAAEIKAVKEKNPQNFEAIAKAFENYQKAQEGLKNRLESLKETSQNPNVDQLLDQLADRVVKHEKLFDELAEKAKHSSEINSIRNAKAATEETMAEALKKDEAIKISERIEKTFVNSKGGELKHLRSVEILDRISQKAPEESQFALAKTRENLLSAVEEELKNLIEQRGIEALKETLDQLPGDELRHMSVLEEVNQEIKLSLPHLSPAELKLSLPHLMPEDQRTFSEMDVPDILDQVLEGLNESLQKSDKETAYYAESEIDYVEKLLERNRYFYSELAVEKISADEEARVSGGENLLNQAEEKLQQAEYALTQGKYSEALGLARSAEVLAREGTRAIQTLILPEVEFTTGEPSRLETELFFDMEVNGVVVGSFKEVDGLENAIEVIEYAEGTDQVIRKRPGGTKYSNIILRRGNLHTPELWEWYKKVINGVTERKSISVIMNKADKPIARYNYSEAWPCKWQGADLDAASPYVPLEEVSICLEPVKASAPAPEPLCQIQCLRYEPVCGADGKTYSCGYADAECNGVKVSYPGECKAVTPPVEEQGCYCAQVYDPVCGTDGKTYSNLCEAKCVRVEVSYAGECRAVSPCGTEPVLDTPPEGCKYDGPTCVEGRWKYSLVCPTSPPSSTSCTKEAKLCPDGSYVSRVAPNCEFSSCPVLTEPEAQSSPPASSETVAPPPSSSTSGTTVSTEISATEFKIEADDYGFYPSSVTGVAKGANIKIHFIVRNSNVYYGGLDFRSIKFKTGAIKPGGISTVEFVADQSFEFYSYWPLTNNLKATGSVTVQ